MLRLLASKAKGEINVSRCLYLQNHTVQECSMGKMLSPSPKHGILCSWGGKYPAQGDHCDQSELSFKQGLWDTPSWHCSMDWAVMEMNANSDRFGKTALLHGTWCVFGWIWSYHWEQLIWLGDSLPYISFLNLSTINILELKILHCGVLSFTLWEV